MKLVILIIVLIIQISIKNTIGEVINSIDGNILQVPLQHQTNTEQSFISNSNECLIKNDKHPKDYLYATKEKENYLVNQNLKDTFMNHFTNNRKVYLYPFTQVNMFNRLRWRIVPFVFKENNDVNGNNESDDSNYEEIENISNEGQNIQNFNFDNLNELIEESKMYYFIISTIYDEYLCASSLHTNDIFKTRRLVQAQKLDKKKAFSEKSCMWRIEKVKSRDKLSAKSSYHIWNVKYNEPLYAASSFFNTNEYGRSIYTWYKKPNSDQFKWSFNCQNSSIQNVIKLKTYF
jgi:hypothetical protein